MKTDYQVNLGGMADNIKWMAGDEGRHVSLETRTKVTEERQALLLLAIAERLERIADSLEKIAHHMHVKENMEVK